MVRAKRAMNEELDDLILLLFRTSGMRDAVLTFEEETGVHHAEAATAVRELVRRNRREERKAANVATRVIGSLFAAKSP
jgi:hypothetical protein